MFVFAEWSHQLQPMGLVHIIGIVSASSLYNTTSSKVIHIS